MTTFFDRFRAGLATSIAAVVATALPMTPATGAIPQPASYHPADALVVSPGRLGSLRMGTSTANAERLGWIARDGACPGWTAGPRSIKISKAGYEVFKAYPEKVKAGEVLSMWATGQVVTTKGIRTHGIGESQRRGSSLRSIQEAYPKLRTQGAWTDPASGESAVVYSVGSASRGWLDFFVAESTSRLWFVVVRTDDVRWRFKGADGC